MDFNLLTYNALDGACTVEVADQVFPDLRNGGFYPAYERTARIFEPLIFIMTRGIKVDFDALRATKNNIELDIAAKQETLNKMCGRALNVASPKDCQKYFYVEKGIKPYISRTTGNITTDDDAMLRIARGTAQRAGLPEARLVQELRGLKKLKGTYLDIEFDADGRLRCSYNPRGTKFGRLSSSKTVFGTGTNLQNLPQEFKQFLTSDEGYFLVEVDKRQAEWVVVAYASGDPSMIRILEEGGDVHAHTIYLMLKEQMLSHRMPVWEEPRLKALIKRDHKLVSTLTDPERIRALRLEDDEIKMLLALLPRAMSGRQLGKKSNHALNYGEGYKMFAFIAEIEEREGKLYHALYHGVYPGVRHWWDAIQNQLRKDRTLTNCFGRKIRFYDAWGEDLFKAAYSSIPQSTVVDGLNEGMCLTYEDADICSPRGTNVDLLAQVHDSVLFQFPLSILDRPGEFARVMHRIYSNMEPEMEYGGRRFKIWTDMKVGWNWGAMHKERNPRGMVETELTPSNMEDKVRGLLGVGKSAE